MGRGWALLAFCWLWVLPGFCQAGDASSFQIALGQARDAEQRADYVTAAAAYKTALQTHPEIAELWANLGVMQHESHDYADAITTFQRARALKPDLFVPNLFLGIDYVRTGQPRSAVSFLLRAEQLQPNDPQVRLALARAYFSLKAYSSAVHAYDQALERGVDNIAALFGRGISYLEWVETDADTLSERATRSAYAEALLAESLVEENRDRQAVDTYTSVVSAPNGPPCTHGQFGFLYLKLNDAVHARQEFDAEHRSDPGCALADLGTAELNIRDGAIQDALDLLQRLWNANHGFVRSSLGLFIRTMPQPDFEAFTEAAQRAEDAGRMSPDLVRLLVNPPEQFANDQPDTGNGSSVTAGERTAKASPTPDISLGFELYRNHKYAACAEILRMSSDRATDKALLQLASCSFFAGEYEVTSKAASLLEKRSTGSPEALYWSIKANQKLALIDLAHFENRDPNSARTHILLGDVYRQSHRYSDAKAEYLKALAISAHDPGALIGLASTLLLNSNADQAMSTCREALKYLPDDPELNLLMGESLLTMRQYNQAEAFLKKGLMAKPEMQPHAHALLGRLYAATDRPSEAARELKLGLESDEDGSLHYVLALQYRKLGDEKDSLEAIKESKLISQARLQRAHIDLADSASSIDQ